jgi:hypothetical protein
LNKRAFVTIEILIAMVIGFLAIIMLTSSIKSLQKVIVQQRLYEELYITVLSLKDTIRAKSCMEYPTLEGVMNGFEYKVSCNQKKAVKNYIDNYDPVSDMDMGGNYGIFMIYLFDVQIEITQKGLKKKYRFYQSEQKRLISEEELLNEMLGV